MLRSSPASAMQKTYDDCYLICSTAVYFEKQNNEEEALRSWRSALDNIYYFNAYKMSPSYRPKNETEKALQDSLTTMERQCKERVDLLQALKKSRDEQTEDDDSIDSFKASAKNSRSGSTSTIPTLKTHGPRPDVPPPYLNTRRLPMPTLPHSQSSPAPGCWTSRSDGTNIAPAGLQSKTLSTPVVKASRTPSPEKKGAMLRSTLRSNNRDQSKSDNIRLNRTMRSSKPTAAGKAATLAWPSASNHTPSGSLTSASDLTVPSIGAIQSSNGYTSSPSQSQMSNRPGAKPPGAARHKPLRAKQPDPFAGFTGATDHNVAQLDLRADDRLRPANSEDDIDNKKPSKATDFVTHLSHNTPNQPLETYQAETVNNLSQRKLKPLADFPTYRKEFQRPKSIAVEDAQNLATQMNANYGPDTSPSSKKVPPPIPRKAIGGQAASRSRVANGGDLSTQGENSIDSAKHARRTPTKEFGTDISVGEISLHDRRQSHINATEWDTKVQSILKNLPPGVDDQAAKAIFNEIVIKGDEVHWDDVAGLEIAKAALKEAVVYPFLRPDLFMGLREPARGMLLFGPPGTGKTMLARAVATESKSTFFAISASSLTSKFLGESEKLVRALFALAKAMAPSIIFVDEIDSLLSARGGSSEHEATRRIKTEFLIQWSDLAKAAAGREPADKYDGDATRVLVLAATNLPWAIDEAARRRFVRRQYIPLPEPHVRESQLRRLMSAQKHHLSDDDFAMLVRLTEDFSGSDITALAKDAAMGPLRSLGERLLHMAPDDIRPISVDDFSASLINIRPSVGKQGLKEFEDWAKDFGERGG